MTAVSPAPRRHLPLRFSLRVLLLAVTAFAIGFPIWYRWPYEEEQVTWEKDSTGKDDYSRPPNDRRVSTWQRQWGGGPLQHGEERHYIGGKLYGVTSFVNGKRHGPSHHYDYRHGYLAQERFYNRGAKEGVWKKFDGEGRERLRTQWHNDRFVRADSKDNDGNPLVVEVRQVQGKPRILFGDSEIEDRLTRLVDERLIDDVQVAEQLTGPTDIDFVETPCQDAMDFLSTQHEIPIQADHRHVDRNVTVTGSWEGIPLATVLTLLGREQGLACDYRYGVIWITSPEGAKDWRDPTGVAEIVPPNESQLAKSWNEPVKIRATNTPLTGVLAGEAQRLAIAVDTSGIESDREMPYPVTQRLNGIKFRHALGILLYQTRCRCKLEGETLVILPPEESP